jgi:hypothetical protein
VQARKADTIFSLLITARLLILGSFTVASMAMMSVMHSHLSRPTSAANTAEQNSEAAAQDDGSKDVV